MSLMSKRLVASYILDVIVIIVFALISYGFSKVTPHFHPFSLLDLSISYPLKGDTVTDADLIVASVVVPAIVIFVIALLGVPRPATIGQMSRGVLLRRKAWEWFVGWLGLALSLITQFLITQGLKNVIGKPRPDMLARCIPDVDNITAYAVGGYGQPISNRWVLVDQTICQQGDQAVLYDGFRSFPSGHAATSFSGLFYLTLYLCTKFAIAFPLLPVLHPREPTTNDSSSSNHLRDEAASAPTWLLFLVYVPVGGALYISGSRYFDYHHHGFDIITGALIGITTSYFAYRWYHVPIGRSAGWSWGPRSRDRAFGVGVDSYGYVGATSAPERISSVNDLELGGNGGPTHGERRVHGPLQGSGWSPLVGSEESRLE